MPLARRLLAVGLLCASACARTRDWKSSRLEGHVEAGESFSRPFGPGLELRLDPIEHGWEICVRATGSPVNLAGLTPPFHGLNARYLEGWHIRNSDNTGPNETGDKNVNAPQELREFTFSPHITAETPTTHEEVVRAAEAGRGILTMTDFELSPIKAGELARILSMTFQVELQWK